MKCQVLYKDKTSRGTNYYKVMVEIAEQVWEDAVYFGNTEPKEVTSLKPYKNSWIAQIQAHTSRDAKTGQFKGRRVLA